jgi:phosphotransferase system HPr (HPr) family protein
MTFEASIAVAAGDREANAKSLLAVLSLGAKGGSALRLRADGEDAPVALDALAGCVATLE